jgi:hypothetical protein
LKLLIDLAFSRHLTPVCGSRQAEWTSGCFLIEEISRYDFMTSPTSRILQLPLDVRKTMLRRT